MALFSDVDWAIVLAVGAFLLLGRGNAEALRTFGRWYGRAVHLKQELLNDFARAADLPVPGTGAPASIRTALLGLDAPVGHGAGIPAAVTVPPAVPAVLGPTPPAFGPWTGGTPTPTWSMTVTADPWEASR